MREVVRDLDDQLEITETELQVIEAFLPAVLRKLFVDVSNDNSSARIDEK